MALISKMHPQTADKSCQLLYHQFTDSCTVAALDMFFATVKGSATLFTAIYLLNFLLRASRGKDTVKSFFTVTTLQKFCKSLMYGSTTGTIFIIVGCLSRYCLGRFTDITLSFIPAFVGAVPVLFESRDRRHLVITSYANMALETLLRRLEEIGALKWTQNQQTFVFMLANAVLMYCMKKYPKSQQTVWFFTPNAQLKRHTSEKEKYLKFARVFFQYFAAGFALQAARLLFANFTLFKNPIGLLSNLLQTRNMTLGLFLGTYAASFQVFEAYLNENTDMEKEFQSLLAGFLAGAAFRIQPSSAIFSSAIVNIFQMTLDLLQKKDKPIIPKWSYETFLFCLYNGFLYQMRNVNPSTIPRTFIRIMSITTSKRSDYIFRYYAELISGFSI